MLLLYAAELQFPDGLQRLSAEALRGLQDTRVPMLLAIFILLDDWSATGYQFGVRSRMGPLGVWLGLITALTVATPLMGWRFMYSRRVRASAVQ
ncbi:hypothetical protein NYP20_14895 [Pseudomonas sp. N3-W]|nr:hypothetical protein [Pseudomonas sp. N3-W]UWF52174.1 hypothetical protein NYP20_14895 [Pseudomonas sp. N3-W]